MKRDLDLIRDILLRLQDHPMRWGSIKHFEPDDPIFTFPGRSKDEVAYHVHQIMMSGFIDNAGFRPSDGGIGFRALTPAGHDFVEAVRDPDVWQQAKSRAEKAGGWTLGLVREIAVGVIKDQLRQHGVPLG